jgi:4-hydroxy-tetrahydrodipicolinate reductase
MMRLLLIGHGRMGRLVEQLAASHDCEVAAIVTSTSDARAIAQAAAAGAKMAIDFSLPGAVPDMLPRLAEAGVSAVIGTTGWQAEEARLREVVAKAGIGVLFASNFSLGMHIFRLVAVEAAARFAGRPDVGAWIHETHHSAKKDAPSGTAATLKAAMAASGYTRQIDVASTRAGSVPGTHTIGFDGPAETVTLTHAVRDRGVFAHGALEAARWLEGRSGWFGIDDMFTSERGGER